MVPPVERPDDAVIESYARRLYEQIFGASLNKTWGQVPESTRKFYRAIVRGLWEEFAAR